jgi:hypothetical protein
MGQLARAKINITPNGTAHEGKKAVQLQENGRPTLAYLGSPTVAATKRAAAQRSALT